MASTHLSAGCVWEKHHWSKRCLFPSKQENLRLKFKIQLNNLLSKLRERAGMFCEVIKPNVEWVTWEILVRLKGHWDLNPQVSLLFLLEGETEKCCWTPCVSTHPQLGRLEVCSEAACPPYSPCPEALFPGTVDLDTGFSLNLKEYQVSEQMWVCIVCLFLWNAPEVHKLNLFDILQDKTQVGEEKLKERKGIMRFS